MEFPEIITGLPEIELPFPPDGSEDQCVEI
jgi:hypothetical protein